MKYVLYFRANDRFFYFATNNVAKTALRMVEKFGRNKEI